MDRAREAIETRARQVVERYGAGAADAIRSAGQRFGEGAAQALHETYERYGKGIGDRLGELYRRHGSGIVDGVRRTLSRHGAAAGAAVLAAYTRLREGSAARVHEVIDRWGPAVGARAVEIAAHVQARAETYLTPENAARALNAAITTVALYERFEEVKKRATKEAISFALDNIEVEVGGRRVSLHEATKGWIREKAPFLRGSTIADDPVEALTYGLIYRDMDYVTQDLRIVPTGDGGFCSMTSALAHASPLDVDTTLEMLDVADGFATLADGNASAEDVVAAATVLRGVGDLRGRVAR